MKSISVLGSTGSIGTQTLEIVRANEDLSVCALAVMSNIKLLELQTREFMPKCVCVYDDEAAKEFKENIKDLDVEVLTGMDGLIKCATLDKADVVLTAVVGMIGIRPTIAAIKAGKDIALANKETLVCAGHIIMPLIKEKGVSLLPVDSEHSAIFQSMNGENKSQISRILLTASGGPFRNKKLEELEDVTVKEALAHPNWSMGKKISIDSATMVNKGLEVMEARWLFDVDYDNITVVVHPESIVHSMVEYADGAVIAQLGVPDMKLPIQYALLYPDRRNIDNKRLNLFEIKNLTFLEPDLDTFKGLELAYKVGKMGGVMPTIYNAANERAVALFLAEKIKFNDIFRIIEKCIEHFDNTDNPDIETILNAEQATYDYIERMFFQK